MFQSLRDLGTEDSISFYFAGRITSFYFCEHPNKSIRSLQDRAMTLRATSL
jgi:hypothetical protein